MANRKVPDPSRVVVDKELEHGGDVLPWQAPNLDIVATHRVVPNSPPHLDVRELENLDRWWRAANYLSVGQIYLVANPLLREPLQRAHIKKRLLGHWEQRRDSISSMRILIE
jgi:hypothetical protein